MAVEQREAARGETVIHSDHDAIHFLGVYRELARPRWCHRWPSTDCNDKALIEALWSRNHVFRTLFTDRRGVEALGSVWTFLDLTPLGRQEDWEDSPEGYPQTKPYEWWRRHDEYEDT